MSVAALAVAAIALPVAAQAPVPQALASLAKGSWALRDRTTGASQRICIRSGREVIQLRHNQPGCRQVVVHDEPRRVTVHYTCEGNGYGRTTVRVEDSGLAQLRSQGVVNGAPFSVDAEIRRVGDC